MQDRKKLIVAMLLSRLLRLLDKINVSRYILKHLLGDNHTDKHRKCVGIVIMASGVCLVKATMAIDSFTLHIIGDVVGYAIHGIGLIPFVSDIEKIS